MLIFTFYEFYSHIKWRTRFGKLPHVHKHQKMTHFEIFLKCFDIVNIYALKKINEKKGSEFGRNDWHFYIQ